MNEPVFYINGDYVERSRASLSIENIGLQRSFGIFDLFRTRNRIPTFLPDYLNRFDNSQRFLGLSEIVSKDKIQHIIQELKDRNSFQHSTFKMLLLGDGFDTDPEFIPHLSVINLPLNLAANPNSIDLITHEYVRENASIKSLNYSVSFSLQRQKIAAGASEILFHADGILSECSRCNVFLVRDGHIATPSRNILEGITRKHVMSVASGLYQLEVRDVTIHELWEADEIFVTSTTKAIMPVTKIDGKSIGGGQIGVITKKLQGEFQDYIESSL